MSWFRKKDRSNTAAPSRAGAPGAPDMSQMVRMLAGAPQEQRVAMLSDRLTVFAGQDADRRERGMRAMLVAALALPDEEYRKIAAARLEALGTLPETERMALMRSHAAIVKGLAPEQRAREMAIVSRLVGAMPEPRRAGMMGMMRQLGLTGESGS